MQLWLRESSVSARRSGSRSTPGRAGRAGREVARCRRAGSGEGAQCHRRSARHRTPIDLDTSRASSGSSTAVIERTSTESASRSVSGTMMRPIASPHCLARSISPEPSGPAMPVTLKLCGLSKFGEPQHGASRRWIDRAPRNRSAPAACRGGCRSRRLGIDGCSGPAHAATRECRSRLAAASRRWSGCLIASCCAPTRVRLLLSPHACVGPPTTTSSTSSRSSLRHREQAPPPSGSTTADRRRLLRRCAWCCRTSIRIQRLLSWLSPLPDTNRTSSLRPAE